MHTSAGGTKNLSPIWGELARFRPLFRVNRAQNGSQEACGRCAAQFLAFVHEPEHRQARRLHVRRNRSVFGSACPSARRIRNCIRRKRSRISYGANAMPSRLIRKRSQLIQQQKDSMSFVLITENVKDAFPLQQSPSTQ